VASVPPFCGSVAGQLSSSDITGLSGLRILDAILAGERDPLNLARLCHSGVKSSQDMIAKSFEGDYRPEHLFALRQSLAAFHYHQQLVVEVDQEIQRQLGSLETATTAEPTLPIENRIIY
jgi:transposase